MKLLLNYMLAAALIIIGTTPLQAQQTDAPSQQQNQNQEVTQLIDRLDNLMDRALELGKKDDFSQTQTEGVDREEDQDERADAQRDRTEIGVDAQKSEKEKAVKRLGEDLALSIGSLKNAAERYERVLEQSGRVTADVGFRQDQEEQDQQQQEQQQRAEAEDDDETTRQEMEEIHEHLVAMADELESTIETIERINNSSDSQSRHTPYDTDDNEDDNIDH